MKVIHEAITKAKDGGFYRNPTNLKLVAEADASNHSTPQVYALIFNHDFAKALWGERLYYEPEPALIERPLWEHHLRQMVIADDPIKYLGENLGK